MFTPFPPSRVTRRAPLAAFLLSAVVACGDDGTGPPLGAPGLHVVSGTGTTDTIDARPTQEIVVEVRDANGRPWRGVEVRFADAAPPVYNAVGERVPFLLRNHYGWVMHAIVDTTDAAGRAQVWVRTSYFAGERAVEVDVPAHALVDTARFTVLPGAATGIRLEPADTIVMTGATASLRGTVHDRAGNARPDAVEWRLLSGDATLDGGKVTIPAAGFATVAVSFDAWADTAVVFSTTPGTLAGFATHSSVDVSLVLLEVDGTRRRTVLRGTIDALGDHDRVPHWSPGTSELYFQLDNEIAANSTIWAIDTLGRLRPLLGASFMRWQRRPQPSSDGWVYFYGNSDPGTDTSVWRMRSDGSRLEGLATGRSGTETDLHPTPSPDGTRIVFTRMGNGSAASLHVLELATGRVTPLGVGGYMARWSPTGERIAYFDWVRDELRVVDADGTNDRSLGRSLGYPFSWSPDGRWILGLGGNPTFVIVDASTGARVRVPGAQGLSSPAWVR